ncbi:restriction endonuclease subunit S [Laspinema palackyanum]|uniref:restriction endonuclease subunit S n=1 Tax=Laspinema palackyanum TaxID=3231601 RepID=UPI00345D5CA8|nr:restriction endonuclease subunit S [Laspinema sp. D2c]
MVDSRTDRSRGLQNLPELSQGWVWTITSEICASVRDGTHDTPKYVVNGVPLVTSKNLKNNCIDFVNTKKISDEDHQQISLRSGVDKGDILMAMIGTIGNPVVVETEIEFSIKNVALFKKNESAINSLYLKHWLQSEFLKNFLENEEFLKGSTQKFIPLKYLRVLPVPLPPLNEQRRIVAKLKKLLAKVDACKQRLEKIPTILTRFRQSVLAAACSGRLTADWRKQNPDVEPASELLKRIQEESQQRYEEECAKAKAEGRRKPKTPFNQDSSVDFELDINLPCSWCVTSLGSITETQGGIQKTPKRKPKNNPYPYLRVANVYRGYLNLDNIEYFEIFNSRELNTWKLQAGDLLIVEGNGSSKEIGRCAIWNGDIENCVHQNHIIRSRPLSIVQPSFLLTYLNSPQAIVVMMQLSSSTSGLHTLSVSKINNIVIPLAPLPEQQEIVRRVEALFQKADRIEQRYEKAKAHIDQLTQSILAKAFRGELVPQDPNDEPASVLLDRIREERANPPQAKTAKKSTEKTPKGTGKRGRKKAQPPEPPESDNSEPIQLTLPGIE